MEQLTTEMLVSTVRIDKLLSNGEVISDNIDLEELDWTISMFDNCNMVSISVTNEETNATLKLYREHKLRRKVVLQVKDATEKILFKRSYVRLDNLLSRYRMELNATSTDRGFKFKLLTTKKEVTSV